MAYRVLNWFGLISIITISLFGFGFYITFITILVSFLAGIITILYFNYDKNNLFSIDLDSPDDPLQLTNYSIQLPKVIELFQEESNLPKFDNRITGSDTVDSYLNDMIMVIINDYVSSWYEILTDDNEFKTHAIKKMAVKSGVNIANRVKSVDWVHLLSTKFPEELTVHLKLFKQSHVRLKHISLTSSKEVTNGNGKPSPKKQDEKKSHRRNKSDTDLSWQIDPLYGKSKFFDSNESLSGKTLTEVFFELEASMENKLICRDIFCTDPEKENAILCEISEAILYLVAPEEAWKCHSMKLLLIEFLSSVVLRPILHLLTDPDNVNRAIIRSCCRDSSLPSDLFLLVIRCCTDAEELDATLDLVEKDIQKLHSKDSAGEWELQDRQKLSSLQYVTRIIQARRATVGPLEGSTSNANTEKVSEEATRTLKFLRATTAWRSNAQYLLEIELNEADVLHTSKMVLDNLRSSALELCDLYLAPNRPTVMGVPENCYSDLVRKITTEGEEFTNNPVICFDEVQKCVCDALEDDPSWQSDYMMDNDDSSEKSGDLRKDDKPESRKCSDKCRKIVKNCLLHLPKLFHKPIKEGFSLPSKSFTFPRCVNRSIIVKNHTLPKCKKFGDSLPVPGARHNRSRSDIVGNLAQKMMNEAAGPSSLSSVNTNLSMSHSEISRSAKNLMSPLSASIYETALGQEKGRSFGIYAITVTRLSDNEVWHIYRRYSDFYDLHASIKEKWPELGNLPFPGKKTFQNTSRNVLETRKRILNNYLQSLTNLARETRYMTLMSQDYLGGFLSPEIQSERHGNIFDALFVNSIKAGVRTLKNMPDQFANTVDGVMDGISKVFQGKNVEYYDTLRTTGSSDSQDDGDESVAFKLLEEVLGIRGLWLRRRLLAPLRTLIADRVNKKVFEIVSTLTSSRNVAQYLKMFKQWLNNHKASSYANRDSATKARTRIVAKVALLSACSDDLRHIVGTDTARRGLLTLFDMFQTQEINKRLVYVFFEAILTNLFPDNKFQDFFKKMYSSSPRVPAPKKSANVL